MDIKAAASLSAGLAQDQVATAVGVKVFKLANEQQKSVLTLLDGAIQVADQIAASNSNGAGGRIDVQA
jgi:hypothetical protein